MLLGRCNVNRKNTKKTKKMNKQQIRNHRTNSVTQSQWVNGNHIHFGLWPQSSPSSDSNIFFSNIFFFILLLIMTSFMFYFQVTNFDFDKKHPSTVQRYVSLGKKLKTNAFWWTHIMLVLCLPINVSLGTCTKDLLHKFEILTLHKTIRWKMMCHSRSDQTWWCSSMFWLLYDSTHSCSQSTMVARRVSFFCTNQEKNIFPPKYIR